MDISTKVVESLNGYTVEFTIGVQTFSLQELEKGVYPDPQESAKWYEKQLKHAFSLIYPPVNDKIESYRETLKFEIKHAIKHQEQTDREEYYLGCGDSYEYALEMLKKHSL